MIKSESVSINMEPIIFNSQHSDLPIESGWLLINASGDKWIASYDFSATQEQLTSIYNALYPEEEGGER